MPRPGRREHDAHVARSAAHKWMPRQRALGTSMAAPGYGNHRAHPRKWGHLQGCASWLVRQGTPTRDLPPRAIFIAANKARWRRCTRTTCSDTKQQRRYILIIHVRSRDEAQGGVRVPQWPKRPGHDIRRGCALTLVLKDGAPNAATRPLSNATCMMSASATAFWARRKCASARRAAESAAWSTDASSAIAVHSKVHHAAHLYSAPHARVPVQSPA